MKIYKYALAPAGEQDIIMPTNSTILTVQTQRGQACLWATVEDEYLTAKKRIGIYGTGHEMPSGQRKYIGTFQPNDMMVFHVFEEFDL